ncbi:MAG: UDP-3-O-(3-hydroxymyristoyl)glucosamine N-acyltransferase [Parachlamydiales bacterium]|nr:UDP-3-O-(3-hydroxymyristoyl)glucosamine N-acyltransferase [Parachlamydiales bacterium]
MQYSIKELATLTKSTVVGDEHLMITGVNTLEEAHSGDASFLYNERYIDALKNTAAGVVCIDKKTMPLPGRNYLVCDQPSWAFQKIALLFLPSEGYSSFKGIHQTAFIHPTAKIEEDVTIAPYAVIDKDVFIQRGTYIGSFVFVGLSSVIGKECIVHPGAIIREKCILGDRVILQPGAVIGSCGFGFVSDEKHQFIKIEQLGNVIIEDDVEIGANTTIDRSRFQSTKIKKGSKIDNLVQIAHNVQIGSHCGIAAQTGIAGSTQIGNHVLMGGQVGIVGHVKVADGVLIATRGGVSKSLTTSGKYRGSPATDLDTYQRREIHLRRIENYAQRIQELEKKIEALEKKIEK